MGFEKLIELVVQFLEFFRFCLIVDCYEKGVHLRKGILLRVVEPGLRFQIPGYIDRIITESVVTQIFQCASQSLVTKDLKPVALGVTIVYNIEVIEKAILEVQDIRTAIQDACLCTVAELTAESTWQELCAPQFSKDLTAACRALAKKYGIRIQSVRVNEIAPLRTYRMITGV